MGGALIGGESRTEEERGEVGEGESGVKETML